MLFNVYKGKDHQTETNKIGEDPHKNGSPIDTPVNSPWVTMGILGGTDNPRGITWPLWPRRKPYYNPSSSQERNGHAADSCVVATPEPEITL